MSATDFGIFGDFIKAEVKAASNEIISEKLEPLLILRDFEGVDVLTLDEVVRILRARNKEQVTDACQRGELPFTKIGRDYLFPKVQIVNFLLGRWQKQETEEKPKTPRADIQNKVNNFLS